MRHSVIKQNIGVDISKDDYKVYFYQLFEDQSRRIKASRTFKNNLSGSKDFLRWVQKHRSSSCPVYLTIEATGVYYEELVHFLDAQTDFRLSVILPNMSKAYGKSLNIKTKTDKVDAKLLGQMGLERELSIWKPISEKIRPIKQLCRERVSLLEEKNGLANKLHALSHSFSPAKQTITRLKGRIKQIQRQIKQVELQLEKLVDEDKQLKEQIDNIAAIKGLSLISIATIIAETGAFELFSSRKQLTSYAGYDIVERQSGSSIKGKTKISKKGNRFIRRVLHFPAIMVVKYHPQFRNLYQRVLQKTGVKMKALVAVQRKLLLLIYTLFKKKQAFIPDFYLQHNNNKGSRQTNKPAYAG
jgi:transposase